MVIIKYVDAFKQLEEFATEKWDKVGNLVKYIIDNRKQRVFNDYVSSEFPHGCDEDEFKDFCCEEAKYIIEEIS